MSLLLALTAAGGGISATTSTSQAQSTAATGTFTPVPITGATSTSQAQSTAATGTFTPVPISGATATSEAQSVTATGNVTPAPISSATATSQAQSVSGTGMVVGVGTEATTSTSQAQSASAIGAVTNPAPQPVAPTQLYHLGGEKQRKRTPQELEAFYRSIGALPEIHTATSKVSEIDTQYAPIAEFEAVDSTKRYIEAFERILDRIEKDSAIARYELAKQEKERIQREIEETDIAFVVGILALSS